MSEEGLLGLEAQGTAVALARTAVVYQAEALAWRVKVPTEALREPAGLEVVQTRKAVVAVAVGTQVVGADDNKEPLRQVVPGVEDRRITYPGLRAPRRRTEGLQSGLRISITTPLRTEARRSTRLDATAK